MSISVYTFLKKKPFPKLLLLGFCGLFSHNMVLAGESCLPAWIADPQPFLALPPVGSPTVLEVDSLSQPERHIFNLKGQVHIYQPGMILLSDFARINQKQQTAQSWGQVTLFNSGLIILADQANLNKANNTALLKETQYQFQADRSHGKAKTIHIDQAQNRAKLEKASYTTCPIIYPKKGKEGKLDWNLHFSTLEINNQTRRIYGHHARLHFKQIPILYTPYISFPMDERASGLLFPTMGNHKSITQDYSEFYFSQPIYINLAPHYDTTLTLIKMESRGLALENEFRYLQPNHSAEFTLTGLNDQLTQKEGLAHINRAGIIEYGAPVTQRWRGKLSARQQWTPNLSSSILWHEVSDPHFYSDIPVEPLLKTTSQIQRHIRFDYRQGNFRGNVNFTRFLRLRQFDAYSYEKRPQINLSYGNNLQQQGFEKISYNLRAQVTKFAIPVAGHNRPEAKRTVFTPAIRYVNYQTFGQLEATLIANQSHYAMQDNPRNNTVNQSHQISVPQFAIKAGLNFERPISFGQTNLIQTLEPRIQYLYVPYQKQSHIPLFDTGKRSLDFSNLFAYNRFSGADRIGDANQISVALTTRFLNQDSSPLAEAGLGQIFYLADRRVQLRGNIPETSKVSDYFVKLGATMGPVHFTSTSQYSHQNYDLTHANNRLRLNLAPNFNFLLAHSLSNNHKINEIETLATGFNWQINPTWSLGSYWNYHLTQNRKVESKHALRYDSCCWASELSIQETRLSNGLYNYSIQYVFELKGLSSVGNTFKNYLNTKLSF